MAGTLGSPPLLHLGAGEGGEPRAEKPLEKEVRQEEDKKSGANLEREGDGEQAVGRRIE